MTIQEIEIKYGTDSNYITLHAVKEMDDFTITIKDAYMLVTENTSNDVKLVIDGFVGLVSGKAQDKKENKAKPLKPRKTRALFTEEQKADIIRRYKAGEGPKAISTSLGCARSTIGLIIKHAGAVEGRTGAHLNKSKVRPEPEKQESEPEPV